MKTSMQKMNSLNLVQTTCNKQNYYEMTKQQLLQKKTNSYIQCILLQKYCATGGTAQPAPAETAGNPSVISPAWDACAMMPSLPQL